MDGLPGFGFPTRVNAVFSQRALCGVVAVGCLIVGMSTASGRDGSIALRMNEEGLDAQAQSTLPADAESHVAGEPGHTLCAQGAERPVAAQTRGIEHLEDPLGCGLPPNQARNPESMFGDEGIGDDVVDREVVDSEVVDRERVDSEVANNLAELESWHRQWGTIPGETSGLAETGMAGGLASKRE